MAWTKLDMINLAANLLGKRSFNQVELGGEFADSVDSAFDLLYPVEISSYDWRFATKIQVLSKTVNEPPDPIYLFEYNLPSDYLALRRLIPNENRFQIYEKQLWSNVDELKIEYRFLPNPSQCPSYFVKYFAKLLAAWFAKTVAEDSGLSAKLEKELVSEKGMAMYIDAQSRPTTALFQNPVIDARYNYFIGEFRRDR